MSRVGLIATVRRLRQEASETPRRDVDVHIAEGLLALGWGEGNMDAASCQQSEIDRALAQRERPFKIKANSQ